MIPSSCLCENAEFEAHSGVRVQSDSLHQMFSLLFQWPECFDEQKPWFCLKKSDVVHAGYFSAMH